MTRFLVTAWLNFLANAQPPPSADIMHEAIHWLNSTASQQNVHPSDDAWSGCGGNGSGGMRCVCVLAFAQDLGCGQVFAC
jgi:hypothetical protein